MTLKKVPLPFKVNKAILALGAQTKNTLCFARGKFAYIGPVHSDLDNPQDLSAFEKEAKYFLKQKPRVIAYDLHPEYQSTKFGLNLGPGGYRYQPVQHHHAHISACMAENKLPNQKVIGVAFDGTGLGGDGTLWGGEFLICNYQRYQRMAHLRQIPLLGGQAAIRQPWRLACAWLDFKFYPAPYKKEWQGLKKMYALNFNTPAASSMGRLFDAAGSLVLKKYQVSREAELAMELEKVASRCTSRATGYSFNIRKKAGIYIIDPKTMFRQIVADLKAAEANEKIAYRFHQTVAKMIQQTCLILREKSAIKQIVLSGGVFQNKLLLDLSLELLCNTGFNVVTHKELSSSDSALSLGQAAVANYLRR
ncbi:MAG: hypothetical protein PHY94_03025 [Candidatus Omnitrophica bacterium]|nr:hypothetical protein [Candidatus Omnitrophota bacterium]